MKWFTGFLAFVVSITLLWAHGNPRDVAEATLDGKKVQIEYGRPQLDGRDLLSAVDSGFVWRMGADAATTLTTETDLVSQAAVVPGGSYSLFARKKGERQWELIVNSANGIHGTQYDEAKNVAVVPLKFEEIESPVELFTIELEPAEGGVQFEMAWGNARLSATFRSRS